MRRGGPQDPYQSKPSPGYYYSRQNSAQPSPSTLHHPQRQQQHQQTLSQPMPRRAQDYRGIPEPLLTPRNDRYREEQPRVDESTPSYSVEHLATFAVGRQFELTTPADGIRKLKHLEKKSSIWPQPFVFRLRHNAATVEDESGEIVEKFPLDLVEQPTAHMSNDPRNAYNNILLFIVREDRKRGNNVTEMHIFQCNNVAANEVADDLQAYMRGQPRRVANGRRSQPFAGQQQQQYPIYADDASISSETSEVVERDVNILNRCFDDIERFVSRIQSAALAQREIEQQNFRYRTAHRKDKKGGPDPNGILQMRAQLPMEQDFVDVFRKFKLSFNLLAKLKNHIHDPNAPELLHFLFSPLSVILEACHWGLGKNIGPAVASPLISLEARELMQNCLTSRESDVWMSLGESWRTPPEDWQGQLPPPYRPIFMDGFAPYGVADRMPVAPNPLHRGESAPPENYRNRHAADTAPNTPGSSRTQRRPQRNMSVDNLELDRLALERERLEFEKLKISERENRLKQEAKQIEDEKRRLQAEKDLIKKETVVAPNARYDQPPSRDSPPSTRSNYSHVKVVVDADTSPRQKKFVDDVVVRGGKLVVATFGRTAQNPKELTVSRGEYLEVLYDEKNWWECKNMHQRVGYVPHTILSMVPNDEPYTNGNGNVASSTTSAPPTPSPVPTPAPPVVRPPPIPPSPPVYKPEPAPEPKPRPTLEIKKRGEGNPQLVSELKETFGRTQSVDVLRPPTNVHTKVSINERSTPRDVRQWLIEKGFSMRVIELLSGQDGANLFSLSKLHLQQAAGFEEGAHLYSQLLVQKKRSNFRTHTADELKAILRDRKNHVEVTNETPDNEPTFVIGYN